MEGIMNFPKRAESVNPLKSEEFPVIYEQGKARAYIVDIQKFQEIKLLVDNLINLRKEDEDALIRDSGILDVLIARAKEEVAERGRSKCWQEQIDAL